MIFWILSEKVAKIAQIGPDWRFPYQILWTISPTFLLLTKFFSLTKWISNFSFCSRPCCIFFFLDTTLNNSFKTPNFNDMIRTNSEHHFSSFVKTHVSYTVFHVVKSGKGFFLLFCNVNPAIFANSNRKFMTFSRQGTFFGRATITDGLSTFPAMVLPMEKSDRNSAANFCFNKGLRMIWNKGILSKGRVVS